MGILLPLTSKYSQTKTLSFAMAQGRQGKNGFLDTAESIYWYLPGQGPERPLIGPIWICIKSQVPL